MFIFSLFYDLRKADQQADGKVNLMKEACKKGYFLQRFMMILPLQFY
jgi:hypothetical protein